MRAFYHTFLDWVTDDDEVGLIVKSKKPPVLEGLPDVQARLEALQTTGRCVVIGDPKRILPSVVSNAADLAIGIGISSAVIEAVIAGSRGVHCDLSGHRFHSFYEWGYRRVVFDDLEQMMAALKRFKADASSNAELGCYGNHLWALDPFRDGRAGARTGECIRLLVDAFDAGLDRDSAIKIVLSQYEEAWGKDKVIRLGDVTGIA